MNYLRVLSVTPSFNVCGGIESYSMNYFRRLPDDIYMDFITHDCTDDTLKKQVRKRGGRVYTLPPFGASDLPRTLGMLRRFFQIKGQNYDILHCNMANAACFYFPLAKRAGITVRLLHSHQDKAADTRAHALRNIPLLAAGERMATHRVACSRQAGDFLFHDHPYTVIRNAIDAKQFRFDSKKRKELRDRYGFGDSVVLGTVGRLTEQKNQKKLIDILRVLVQDKGLDYRLVIVGEGHLLDELVRQTAALSLEDRIVFTGSVADVSDVLATMDVFVLPSLYEGLGIVNIEAQANGLPVVVSDRVPQDADMGGVFIRVPLEASDAQWAETIQKISPAKEQERSDTAHLARIRQHGYDLETETEKLEEFYWSTLR